MALHKGGDTERGQKPKARLRYCDRNLFVISLDTFGAHAYYSLTWKVADLKSEA